MKHRRLGLLASTALAVSVLATACHGGSSAAKAAASSASSSAAASQVVTHVMESKPDDPHTVSNSRGTVTFATAGPNTRTTQVFVNLGDNRLLDERGFTPFGAVTSGMDVVDKLYSGYGDKPSSLQPEIQNQGNAFLDKRFPKLDHIVTARVTSESNPALP